MHLPDRRQFGAVSLDDDVLRVSVAGSLSRDVDRQDVFQRRVRIRPWSEALPGEHEQAAAALAHEVREVLQVLGHLVVVPRLGIDVAENDHVV